MKIFSTTVVALPCLIFSASMLAGCGSDESTDYAAQGGCSAPQETAARAEWISRELPAGADNPTPGQCEAAADSIYAALNDADGGIVAGRCYLSEETTGFRDLIATAEAKRQEWTSACGSGFQARLIAAQKRDEFRSLSQQPAEATILGLRARAEWETYVPDVDLRRCIEEAYAAAPNETLAFFQASCQVTLGMPAADPWPLPPIATLRPADERAPLPQPMG